MVDLHRACAGCAHHASARQAQPRADHLARARRPARGVQAQGRSDARCQPVDGYVGAKHYRDDHRCEHRRNRRTFERRRGPRTAVPKGRPRICPMGWDAEKEVTALDQSRYASWLASAVIRSPRLHNLK